MKRKYQIAALVTTFLLCIPTSAFAASPAVGTAAFTTSILSVTSQLSSVASPHIEIGIAGSKSTTDQVRQNLGTTLARASLSFLPANVANVAASPALAVSANSDDKPNDNFADGVAPPLADAATVAGDISYTGMRAAVTKSPPTALATLGNAVVNLTLLNNLISLNGLKVGVSSQSLTDAATSQEGISAASIRIASLGDILTRATTLTSDEILALATSIGGSATASQVTAVQDAKAAAIAAANSIIPGIAPSSTSISTLLSCGAPLNVTIPILNVSLCSIGTVNTALSTLQSAVNLLTTALKALPLLSINDLKVGMMATASDTASSASSSLTWGTSQVAGTTLPASADPQTALVTLNATLATVTTALQNSTSSLAGLTITLVGPSIPAPTTSTDGAYHLASSSLRGLQVGINLASAAGVSLPLVVDATLFTLSTSAEHRPSIIDPPAGGTNGSPNGAGPGPLAKTGTSPTWIIGGIMLLAFGLRLRRWLGDAA